MTTLNIFLEMIKAQAHENRKIMGFLNTQIR